MTVLFCFWRYKTLYRCKICAQHSYTKHYSIAIWVYWLLMNTYHFQCKIIFTFKQSVCFIFFMPPTPPPFFFLFFLNFVTSFINQNLSGFMFALHNWYFSAFLLLLLSFGRVVCAQRSLNYLVSSCISCCFSWYYTELIHVWCWKYQTEFHKWHNLCLKCFLYNLLSEV